MTIKFPKYVSAISFARYYFKTKSYQYFHYLPYQTTHIIKGIGIVKLSVKLCFHPVYNDVSIIIIIIIILVL
jgi:hypothetical protein